MHLGALPGGWLGANLNRDNDGDDIRVGGIKSFGVTADYPGESHDDLITLDGSESYFTGPFSVAYPGISAGDGNDTIIAGRALDIGSYNGGGGDDTVLGAASQSEFIIGGPERDILRGGAGDNRIDARDGGPDTVSCDGGADRVETDQPGVDDVNPDCEQVNFIQLPDLIVNQGEGAPGSGAAAQTAPLRLKVLRKRVPSTAIGLARRGVGLRLRCNLACRVKASLRIPRRIAERLAIPRRIAAASKRLGADDAAGLRITPVGEIADRLRSSGGLADFKIAIRVNAAPAH